MHASPTPMPTPTSHAHADLGTPSPWVARFAALVPPGEVLDLACGGGRHALLFAGSGHPVLAVDRDAAALQTLRERVVVAGFAADAVRTQAIDLEQGNPEGDCDWPFAAARFSAIVVTNYLHRPLLPHLLRSLAPGGVLLYETFAAGNAAFGKPSNPAFLLQPGELLNVALAGASPLRIVAFEDGYVQQPAPAMVQRLCALRTRVPGATDADTPPWTAQQLRL